MVASHLPQQSPPDWQKNADKEPVVHVYVYPARMVGTSDQKGISIIGAHAPEDVGHANKDNLSSTFKDMRRPRGEIRLQSLPTYRSGSRVYRLPHCDRVAFTIHPIIGSLISRSSPPETKYVTDTALIIGVTDLGTYTQCRSQNPSQRSKSITEFCSH